MPPSPTPKPALSTLNSDLAGRSGESKAKEVAETVTDSERSGGLALPLPTHLGEASWRPALEPPSCPPPHHPGRPQPGVGGRAPIYGAPTRSTRRGPAAGTPCPVGHSAPPARLLGDMSQLRKQAVTPAASCRPETRAPCAPPTPPAASLTGASRRYCHQACANTPAGFPARVASVQPSHTVFLGARTSAFQWSPRNPSLSHLIGFTFMPYSPGRRSLRARCAGRNTVTP